jgi:hypothetical protein
LGKEIFVRTEIFFVVNSFHIEMLSRYQERGQFLKREKKKEGRTQRKTEIQAFSEASSFTASSVHFFKRKTDAANSKI